LPTNFSQAARSALSFVITFSVEPVECVAG